MGRVGVRYIVHDTEAAIEFYTKMFGFEVEIHPMPGFAGLARGDLFLMLNQPGAGGAGRAMPDGTLPEPGGWNRIQIEVDDLEAEVARLTELGCPFRNTIVQGGGGKQILAVDPSGNLIELFQG
jgi:catechol 2,3-dioxygenase-like lactoylglutathione lyase family enzyme